MTVYIVKRESYIVGVYDSKEKAAYVTDTLNQHEYYYRRGEDLFCIEKYEVE